MIPAIIAIGVAILTFVMTAQAQESTTPLPIEAVLNSSALSYYWGPTFAPDGSTFAYVVVDNRRHAMKTSTQPIGRGVPGSALGSDIWLNSVGDTAVHNITEGEGNNWAPKWSPDGRYLAFLSDRGNAGSAASGRLWTWERASGTLRQVSTVDVCDSGWDSHIEWLADSRSIVIGTCPAGGRTGNDTSSSGRSEIRPAEAANGSTASVFTYDPTRGEPPPSDQISLDYWLVDLAIVDVGTGLVRRVSRNSRILQWIQSPDRQSLAWTVATRAQKPGSQLILADIITYNIENGALRRLVADAPIGPYVRISWSPDSKKLAYRTNGPASTQDELYVVTLKGVATQIDRGPPLKRPLEGYETPLWDRTSKHVFFSRDGAIRRAATGGTNSKVFANSQDRLIRMIGDGSGQIWSPDDGASTIVFTLDSRTKYCGIARIDLISGAISQQFEENKNYDDYLSTSVQTPDGKSVVFVAEDARHSRDVWVAGVVGDTSRRQLTHIVPPLLPSEGGIAKMIDWSGLDGDTLRGALIYPAGYRPGKRYPLIVKVYGGVNSSDDINRFGFSYDPADNLQLFASRGYAVLLPDSKLHVGTPMLDLLKSVLPGINRVVDLGVADPERVGLMGHSYGGYSTLSLISLSRRFKAAVMLDGKGDLMASYGSLSPQGASPDVPWAETGQGRMGGSPWEFRERYLENSPFLYLDRVQTPLLIIHGSDDLTVKPYLADQVFVGLRRLGKRVEYARYAGENHGQGGWSRANQIDYLQRIIHWFDEYLKGVGPAGPPGLTH